MTRFILHIEEEDRTIGTADLLLDGSESLEIGASRFRDACAVFAEALMKKEHRQWRNLGRIDGREDSEDKIIAEIDGYWDFCGPKKERAAYKRALAAGPPESHFEGADDFYCRNFLLHLNRLRERKSLRRRKT